MSAPKNSTFHRDFTTVVLISSAVKLLVAKYALHIDVPLVSWVGFAFVSALTLIVHSFLVKASSKRPQLFVASFMGSLTAKLLLSAMFLVVVGVLFKDDLKFTAIGFFILYALLTVVDIKSLLPILRSDNG